MKTYDLRQTIIPFSLLQIINHFKTMVPGETVEIICADDSITEDLCSLLPDQAYTLIKSQIHHQGDEAFKLVLKKAHPEITSQKEDYHV